MKITKAQRRALRAIRDRDINTRFSLETKRTLEARGLIERERGNGCYVLTPAGSEQLTG